MGGQSKVNKEMAEQTRLAREQQQKQFELLQKPTPGQVRFEAGASAFDKWLKEKKYDSAPDGSSALNFDLWNPAHVQRQQERMGNLQGIGAANMGGTGDQSIALQLTRERNANLAGENAGQAWESAVKGTDAYYKTGDMGWANLDISKNLNLLSNATNRESNYNAAYIDTRPRGFMESVFPALLGGALSAGGALLGNPAMFGGKK